MNSIPIVQIVKRLGQKRWGTPRPFGPDGWVIDAVDGWTRIIVTLGPAPDSDKDWLHASISHTDRMPSYEELVAVHKAVFPGGWAYQVFAPPSAHINIHAFALHLWGLEHGEQILPNFGANGSI